jgi:hypothetical protein
MKLPEGITEDRFLEAFDSVIKLLSSKFRFGYYEADDIRQKGAQFAIEAMASEKYDVGQPLENFLYTHIRNRLINFKRDNYMRPDPPCKTCVFWQATPAGRKCGVFAERSECAKYTSWEKRNETKKNLMNTVSDETIGENSEVSTISNDLNMKELEAFIDHHLPMELRSDYLRLRSGASIPAARRERVREAVLNISGIQEFLEENYE